MISVVFYSVAGGIETYTLQLANALAPLARVAYAIDSTTKEQFGDCIDPRVELLEYRRPRLREISGFGAMRELACRMREFKTDIFHLQSDGLWESYLLRQLSKTMKVVNTVHDPVRHIDQRTAVNDWTMNDAIARSSGLVVHSPALKDIVVKRHHIDETRVFVHPHGVYDHYLRYAEPTRSRDKYILFFGELRYNKGPDLLLKAFNAIQESFPDWRIIFAGKAPLANKSFPFSLFFNSRITEKQNNICELLFASERVNTRTEFRNRFISDNEASLLFSRAGVVVLPYRHGSQSGVLALAAAFGCPLLATKVGNIPEILMNGTHAQLVEPEDDAALAEGLAEILENEKKRTAMGENLKNLAYEEWAWERIAANSMKFYQEILHKSD